MQVPLTIRDFLDRAEVVYPDRIGVVDEPDQVAPSWGEVTYREIAARARALAVALDRLGIGPGERVAVVSHNAARLLTAFFGVSGWGRVLVPVNFRLAAQEVRYIIEHSGATVLLVDPELEDVLGGVTATHRFVIGEESDHALFGTDGSLAGVAPATWEPDESATAVINYTSGTTARPKGVQQTHRSLWLNATTFGWHTGISDRDVFLHTLPMFHCNGWGMPYGTTGMGVKQVVIRKIDGAEILRRVEQHGVTAMCGAPAVANMILDAAATWDGPIPGAGRTRIIVAGAPPPSRTIERVETELGWELIQIYGLTETAPLLTINRTRQEWDDLDPAERAQKLMRAGAPAIGIRVAVDDQGEVLGRGNHVLEGYWEQPEATAEAIVDGWFHTGDGGTIDDEGYLTISDRKKDVIISGGENVSSIEAEDALFSHPAVAEVAVIGVPDERWGELILALVVLAPGQEATEDELRDHCRTKLAGYKVPKRIEFRDELARTATGKLQKFKLRAPYWEGRDRQVN
ncbi:AMP-binding protein [Aquihabitans sp. G128]|uniref:AMP-binding protein n=1 Tax=Aquihabitans sp. G128 TaxID=2849779 RepID=UPI001C2451D9|nr:AMP-binding protein [Aquihabitans sp. G128]QXC61150.1 AMP-binding protein [Aquihabitans sp. G128]